MKKLLFITVVLCLAISLILMSCAGSTTPSPTAPTSASPTAQPTTPAQVIKLNWASAGAPVIPYEAYYQQWADQLKQETGGRLEIKLHYSESLVKMADSYTAVESGAADMAGFGISVDPSRVPLTMVSFLPLLGTNGDAQLCSRVIDELIKKYPALAAEYKSVKLITINPMTARSLNMAKKKVLVPDDVKGVKILATGVNGLIFKGLGAAALALPPPDWSSSLSTGLAEGAAVALDALDAFKALEATNYHLNMPGDDLGWGTSAYIMNKAAWDKLPPDIQKLITDKYAPLLQQKITEIQNGLVKVSLDKAVKLGHTFVTATPEQYKLWSDAMLAQIEAVWIAPNEAKGLPARAIYNDFKALTKQYKK